MILATTNDALWDEIGATPDIEDGAGPVLIGTRAVYVDEQGATWYVVCHPFAEVDSAWILAYCSGDNPAVVMLEAIPAKWAPVGAESPPAENATR